MLKPLGQEALPDIRRYIERHDNENIMLMHDLLQGGTMDQLKLSGFACDGDVVAIQGAYASGRWFPHYVDERALSALVAEAENLKPRWILGVARVVDPVIAALLPSDARLCYDEHDHVCDIDSSRLAAVEPINARMATVEDIPDLAELRRQFDADYFGTDPRRISMAWCERVARNYVRLGAAIAKVGHRAVAMVATEAVLPQLAQIAGVYTLPDYRRRGLAHEVLSVLVPHHLRTHARVTLNVRKDNAAALRVYRSLGFRPCGAYRMTRLR